MMRLATGALIALLALLAATAAFAVDTREQPASVTPDLSADPGSDAPLRQAIRPSGFAATKSGLMGDTVIVSLTYRDQLGTATFNRSIAYDPSTETVHMTWQQHVGFDTDANPRQSMYSQITFDDSDNPVYDPTFTHQVGPNGDGYPVMGLDRNNSIPFVGMHSNTVFSDARWDTELMSENAFIPNFWDAYGFERYAEAQPVWPAIAVQNAGEATYVHTVAHPTGEVMPDFSFYYRALYDPAASGHFSNATVSDEGWAAFGEWNYNGEGCIASNQDGVVSTVQVMSRYLTGDDPDNGYLDGTRLSQSCNDIYIYQSTDAGATWNWDNPINVTNFIPPDEDLLPDTTSANMDTLRGYADANVYVDEDGVTHVTFTVVEVFWLQTSGATGWGQGLYYWNDQDQTVSLIADQTFRYDFYEENSGMLGTYCYPGAWQTYMNQCTLTKDEDTGLLYAVWSQYWAEGDTVQYTNDDNELAFVPLDYADLEAMGASTDRHFGLGEIMVAVSPDNGRKWTKAVDITNTKNEDRQAAIDGGLAAGECRSEVQPSVALNNEGDYLHIFYLLDYDGGREFTWEEGDRTENHLVYHRVSKQDILTRVEEQAEWVRNYPLHVDSTDFYDDPNDWTWFGLSVDDPGEEQVLQPDQFELAQNYPNPFNPSTRISFTLAQPGHVSLAVYDVLGREVARLVDRGMGAGRHDVTFRADELASGVYFYRLESGSHSLTRKMLLVK